MKRKKILGCFLAFMLVLVMAMPVFAASGKTPSAVSVTKAAASANSVTVTWKKASNATSYRVYYRQADTKKWTTLATISSKNLKYTHKSSKKYALKGGKKYTYTVKAYNKYGKKWSSYDTKGKTVTIPAVPSAVKTLAKANNYKQVTVTWTKSINATNYLIYYRSSDATKWTRIANVSSKTPKYVHKSSSKYPIETGKTYYYMARGYNKTYKTYGGYDKTGVQVDIPEKPVITPTTTPTVKPTSTPKPTAAPQPTKKPTPKPTQKPKLTATPKPKPTATPDPESPAEVQKKIKEVVRLTNKVRKKYGSPAVKENAALDAGAAVRAKEISIKFAHERLDGRNVSTAYHEAGAGNILGENITTGNSPKRAVTLWEESRGHLVTMIDDRATHIGIGYYKGFWVQIFAENPDQKCALIFDANGGYFPNNNGVEKYELQFPKGMKLSGQDVVPIPVREGYTLEGWYESTYIENYGWFGGIEGYGWSEEDFLAGRVVDRDSFRYPPVPSKIYMNESHMIQAIWKKNS